MSDGLEGGLRFQVHAYLKAQQASRHRTHGRNSPRPQLLYVLSEPMTPPFPLSTTTRSKSTSR